MDKHEVRIKALEIVFRKDWKVEDCVSAAKVLEDYIIGKCEQVTEEKAPVKRGRPVKVDNTNILD
jgi:hypothetical protein